MGDFFVDDQFFDHPKVLAAGEDAADLCLRGFAWAHRHNTGLIPKNGLGRLSGKKNLKVLASKLVEVHLWHDEGDNYRIHDWEIRNAKSIAKREQSRSAAKQRWRQHSERNADASVSHSDRSADAMPNQPRNQGTKEPRNALIKPPPTPLTIVGQGDEAAAAFVAEIINQAAERQLENASGPIKTRTGWLAKARIRIGTEWGERLLAEFGDLTVEQAVDLIEPPVKPVRGTYDHLPNWTAQRMAEEETA